MRCVHLLIKGKVQGVFYRFSAKQLADELKIKGTVQNTANDDVEVIACGDPDRINKFIEWCRKGPSRAEVTEIEITEAESQNFTGFKIKK